MQMHLSETRKRRETKTKTYKKLTKEKSAIKRGNKPQASKGVLLKWFDEDICGLPLWRNMVQVYVASLMVISQEVESDIYVFGSGV